jgi:hypothetical protein
MYVSGGSRLLRGRWPLQQTRGDRKCHTAILDHFKIFLTPILIFRAPNEHTCLFKQPPPPTPFVSHKILSSCLSADEPNLMSPEHCHLLVLSVIDILVLNHRQYNLIKYYFISMITKRDV